MNKAFGVFVLVLVLVSTLGAGYALAQDGAAGSTDEPSEAQYEPDNGGAPAAPASEAYGDDAGSASPSASASAPAISASASASASAGASSDAGSSVGAPTEASPGQSADAWVPAAESGAVGVAGEAPARSASARASASAPIDAGPGAPPDQGEQPQGGASDMEVAWESAEVSASPAAEESPEEEASPPPGVPEPSAEPPVARNPFTGETWSFYGTPKAWRAHPCGKDNCGLADVPEGWQCYTYKKTVWGDVTYACSAFDGRERMGAPMRLYDENGELLYEGARGSESSWIEYRGEACDGDCRPPDVLEDWHCSKEYRRRAPRQPIISGIRCQHPELGHTGILEIDSRYCALIYDAEYNVVAKQRCLPNSGGGMGAGAGGDAHDADVGLEQGDGNAAGNDQAGGALQGRSEDGSGGAAPPTEVFAAPGLGAPAIAGPSARDGSVGVDAPSEAGGSGEPAGWEGSSAGAGTSAREVLAVAGGIVESLVPGIGRDVAGAGVPAPGKQGGPDAEGVGFARAVTEPGAGPAEGGPWEDGPVDSAEQHEHFLPSVGLPSVGLPAARVPDGRAAGLEAPVEGVRERGEERSGQAEGRRAQPEVAGADRGQPGRDADLASNASGGKSGLVWLVTLGAGAAVVVGLAAKKGAGSPA